MGIDSAKLQKIVENIEGLPTLPTVVNHLVSITQSPKTSASDVGNLISRDQALTSKVLRLVNSAFYGFPKQIKTVTHAIVILGFSKVKNIVLTASVFDACGKHTQDKRFSVENFWLHSLGTAIGARIVSKLNDKMGTEDSFVAGLLHDLGKIIISQFLPDLYTQVYDNWCKTQRLIYDCEKEVLGLGHDAVGIWLAKKWNLPENLVQAIRSHHQPSLVKGAHQAVVYNTHLGDILARTLNIGNGGDNRIPAIDNIVWKDMGLSLEKIDGFLGEMQQELERADDFIELIKK